jgi:hypothetical protein
LTCGKDAVFAEHQALHGGFGGFGASWANAKPAPKSSIQKNPLVPKMMPQQRNNSATNSTAGDRRETLCDTTLNQAVWPVL